MKIAILADEALKTEWLARQAGSNLEWLSCGSVKTFVATVADVYVDLLYVADPERNKQLAMRAGFPFFVNAVEYTNAELGPQFIRISAWPGFLQSSLLELAVTGDPAREKQAEEILTAWGWKFQWVPDIPGMIGPRMVASIINEAYYTYGDQISSKEEIDTAMKLGTSYPLGPFEWNEKIGPERVYALLKKLSRSDARFTPAPAFEQEILQRKAQ